MIKEAIDRIISLAETNVRQIGDYTYSDRPLVLVEPPKIEPISLNSLVGMIEYIKSGEIQLLRHGELVDQSYIHIQDHRNVRVITQLKNNRRDTMVKVLFEPAHEFKFGQWMGPDEFIVAFKSNAVTGDCPDYNVILKVVSSISIEHLATMRDSGVAQSIATKSGINYELTEVPQFVRLEFRRTFPDIDQGDSEYFLRIRQVTSPAPGVQLALFETTFDDWESKARERIARWIKNWMASTSGFYIIE